jgi:hypothetical protein
MMRSEPPVNGVPRTTTANTITPSSRAETASVRDEGPVPARDVPAGGLI